MALAKARTTLEPPRDRATMTCCRQKQSLLLSSTTPNGPCASASGHGDSDGIQFLLTAPSMQGAALLPSRTSHRLTIQRASPLTGLFNPELCGGSAPHEFLFVGRGAPRGTVDVGSLVCPAYVSLARTWGARWEEGVLIPRRRHHCCSP